jgi:hypothetical protein
MTLSWHGLPNGEWSLQYKGAELFRAANDDDLYLIVLFCETVLMSTHAVAKAAVYDDEGTEMMRIRQGDFDGWKPIQEA